MNMIALREMRASDFIPHSLPIDLAGAACRLCWTCNSCDLECPVNIATHRLKPQTMVRLANLGFWDELFHMPEIWYCLTCRRCNEVCPNAVKPATLIRYLRGELLRQNRVSYDLFIQYQDLFSRFQRARWHLAAQCIDDRKISTDGAEWQRWIDLPVAVPEDKIVVRNRTRMSGNLRKVLATSDLSSCFTCKACSSACPVVCGGEVFDPVWIFRMANLGLVDELLALPSIWLCIGCKRCTETCTQAVKGHQVIKDLQALAVSEGFVDRGFPDRFRESSKSLYARFLDETDLIIQGM